MKKVLVLGAGLVAGPLVKYLLDQQDFFVVVADVEAGRASRLVGGRPRGAAEVLDIADRAALAAAIGRADLVVSMVPYTFHPLVAELAIEQGRPMITASYVGPAMKALDARAKEKGVILLNELGLDPGIDHMEAMRVIHEVHDAGGSVLAFTSWCGGLPAPEANTNPFGYKFSWSPRGVCSPRRTRPVPQGRLGGDHSAAELSPTRTIGIGAGEFEGYPKRDSVAIGRPTASPRPSRSSGDSPYPGWCRPSGRWSRSAPR
jgi:saccharopine dehydrogenase-like NADP-dependent oxidoreductase